MPDVAIIGGGPAGLSAALVLAEGGLSVAVVDEQPELGGQYYRRPAPAIVTAGLDHRPAGGRLLAAVHAAGVECLPSTLVWGVDDDGSTLLTVRAGEPARRIAAKWILIATGASERTLPFPGWQLPGVTTPGFAQHLATDQVSIGRSVVVAGSGPFLLPVACSLLRLGAKVAGIAEAGRPYRPAARSLAALRYPDRLAEFAGYCATLARHRVPIWQNTVVAAAIATTDGRQIGRVTLAATDRLEAAVRTVDVDALCVGYGFRPQHELAGLLGCQLQQDPLSGDLSPIHDKDGRTSRTDVWVAGEIGGIAGADGARATGQLSAVSILNEAGRSKSAASGRTAGRRARRATAFAALTARLYPVPSDLSAHLMDALPDSTQICRCEGVSAAQVRAATLDVDHDQNAVKGQSRAGMGLCQGRECGSAVRALSETTSPVTARMPIRPIALSAVSGLGAS